MPTVDSQKLLRAIRVHCLDCCGGSRNEVERCTLFICSLHPYRSVDAVSEHPTVEVLSGQLSMFEEGRE